MKRSPYADAAVFVVAIAAFARSLGGTTVWDDEFLTVPNPFLAPARWGALLTRDLWVASAKGEPSGYYRPLASLSLALSSLVSNEAWSYHLGNVVLHALTAVVLRRLVLAHRPSAGWFATLAACVFAVAPITSEAVCWLSGRFDVLGSLFLLLALWANARRRSAAVVALYAAALLSKETFVVAPALVILDDLLVHRARVTAALPKWLGLAVATGLYAVARLASHVPSAALSGDLVTARAVRALAGCLRLYASTFVGTTEPSIFHVYQDGTNAGALLTYGVVLAVTWALVALARRSAPTRPMLFAWIATLVALVPVGLTAPRLIQTGDRYAYTATATFVLFLALGLDRLRRMRPLPALTLGVGLAAFGAGSLPRLLRREDEWKSEESFYRVELDRDPERGYAALLLGEILAKRRDFQGAEPLLLRARTRIPDPYRAEIALCYLYLNENRYAEARTQCDDALSVSPDDPRALVNRAEIRLSQGDLDGAIDDARHAIRVKPRSFDAHEVAAEALALQGREAEARVESAAALAISPRHPRALALKERLDHGP